MQLDDTEVALLRDLQVGLRALLAEPDPDDPVVQRLFPACIVGDDAADEELRRFLYGDLLASRIEGLDAIVAYLDRGSGHRGQLTVDLDEEEAATVLGVLNDVRLTLGVRVGIEHIDRDDLDDDHPAVPTLAVMDHLGWLQENLLAVLDPPSVA